MRIHKALKHRIIQANYSCVNLLKWDGLNNLGGNNTPYVQHSNISEWIFIKNQRRHKYIEITCAKITGSHF